MCYQNFTQISGCGHFQEALDEPYTLCSTALSSLAAQSRISHTSTFAPPKRSKASQSRFFFGRSSAPTATLTRASTLPSTPHTLQIPHHVLTSLAQACNDLRNRAIVGRTNSSGVVCVTCAEWIRHMRNMVQSADEGRGIRGHVAFREFLEGRGPRDVAAVQAWGGGDALTEMRPIG